MSMKVKKEAVGDEIGASLERDYGGEARCPELLVPTLHCLSERDTNTVGRTETVQARGQLFCPGPLLRTIVSLNSPERRT